MEIRSASVKDILTIQHIASLTWPIAYADILTPGQLSYMLNSMYNFSGLQKQMTDEGHIFFLCYDENKAVGFAGISKVDYPLKNSTSNNNIWKLHKLYVLPEAQKTGAGKLLMEVCMQTIVEEKCEYLILNVNRKNPAYHFYLKKGFEVLEEVDLDIGAGFFMVDYIMGKAL